MNFILVEERTTQKMKFLIIFLLLAVLPLSEASCTNFTLELNLLKQHVEMLTNLLTLANQRLTEVSQQLKQNLTKANEDLNQKLNQTAQTITHQIAKTNQELENKVNQKLTQKDQGLTQKVSHVIREVNLITQKEETLNNYCQSNSNRCGSCYCVEDFRIPDKHYCDCRMKPVRRDCKEHHKQGENINGLYQINFHTYLTEVSVFCNQNDGSRYVEYLPCSKD